MHSEFPVTSEVVLVAVRSAKVFSDMRQTFFYKCICCFRCFYSLIFFTSFFHRCRFQFRVFTAPFHRVEFADFWLADQLNSLVFVLMDLEYLICFYIFELQWSNSKGLLPKFKGDTLIHVYDGLIENFLSSAPLSVIRWKIALRAQAEKGWCPVREKNYTKILHFCRS